jgi:hypothetical protein
MINVTDYGLLPDNESFDNTPFFNSLVKSASSSWLYWPTGRYWFLTKPDPIRSYLRMTGDGINPSILQRAFEPMSLTDPFMDFRNSVTWEDLSVITAPGCNGGTGIQLKGLAASQSRIRNAIISQQVSDDGYWGVPLLLDGGGDALGIRGVFLENLEIFAATSHHIWGLGVHGLTLNYVQIYEAGAPRPNNPRADMCIQQTLEDPPLSGSHDVIVISRYFPQAWFYYTQNARLLTMDKTDLHVMSGCANILQLP